MNILLIQPKMKLRPMDTRLKTRMAPSLALLTLSSLTDKKHNLTIINENVDKIDFNMDADLVAITVTVDALPRAAAISKIFRKKGKMVVAGGIHITCAPKTAERYFDSICIGMAEAYWNELLLDAENGKLKKIYSQKEDTKIVSPNYDAIDYRKYLYCNIISTSRGCPFKCDFCYNSSQNSTKYISRPIEDILEEIKKLKTKHIMFIDDNFIGNPDWTREFLNRIKYKNLKWNAAVSSNIVNMPDLLDLMKESGCQSLFIGFETINEISLKSVHKTQNNIEKYNKLISEIHKRGIIVNASLVFGLPDDDKNVFENTLKWVIENKIETVTAHILTPYPGTRLFEDMKSSGKIIDNDFSKYNTAHVVYQPEKMSATELYEGYINFYKELYSFRNILKRLPLCKKQWIPYLLFNLFYRKFGKFTEILSSIIPLGKLGKFAANISYKL